MGDYFAQDKILNIRELFLQSQIKGMIDPSYSTLSYS